MMKEKKKLLFLSILILSFFSFVFLTERYQQDDGQVYNEIFNHNTDDGIPFIQSIYRSK